MESLQPASQYWRWAAGDILHDEVGQPLGRGAGIEYLGDVGMVQGLENAAFVMKPA